VIIVARVWLLQGAAEQSPVSQLFMGATIDVFAPATKIGRRPDGLRHAASGEAITAVKDCSQPDEIDCAEIRVAPDTRAAKERMLDLMMMGILELEPGWIE